MSDAGVKFGLLGGDPAEPGKEQTFSFICPRGKGRYCSHVIIAGRTHYKRDGQNKNGGTAQWDWQNPTDRDAPTFHPSIDCGHCGWHGYIRNGRCVDTQGKDEPEITDGG